MVPTIRCVAFCWKSYSTPNGRMSVALSSPVVSPVLRIWSRQSRSAQVVSISPWIVYRPVRGSIPTMDRMSSAIAVYASTEAVEPSKPGSYSASSFITPGSPRPGSPAPSHFTGSVVYAVPRQPAAGTRRYGTRWIERS